MSLSTRAPCFLYLASWKLGLSVLEAGEREFAAGEEGYYRGARVCSRGGGLLLGSASLQPGSRVITGEREFAAGE